MSLPVQLLRDSFNLVIARDPLPTRRFYGHLFTQSPELQPLFGRHAREAQEKMLAQALVFALDHLDDPETLARELGALGAGHVDYGVTAAMYPKVGRALLTTLAEIAGEAWTPEVEAAWTEAYGALTALMLAGAERRG